MDHGLFGKLVPGSLTEFGDWREIARLVHRNSRNHITMYRSVVSFDENTAEELYLKDQKAWQRYIENHIMTIAEKNGIRREHLQWACALHKEKNHPHVHIVFWDKSSRVKNPFTHPSVPNAIRRQMIKDTFSDKIRKFGETKNIAVTDMRKISDSLVEEFDRHMRSMDSKGYKKLRREFEEDTKLSGHFEFQGGVLQKTVEQVLKVKAGIPANGRIAYQLLPPDGKVQVDHLVKYLLSSIPIMETCKQDYIKSKMNMALLYGGGGEYLSSLEEKFSTEADKIIANRILGMVKSLNRLDDEQKKAEYMKKQYTCYAEQMFIEIMDLLSSMTDASDQEAKARLPKGGEQLSKEARRELYLKYQDKGYEH